MEKEQELILLIVVEMHKKEYVNRRESYVMDKGYDSEKIHSLMREEIKADSIIPLKQKKGRKSEENRENNCI